MLRCSLRSLLTHMSALRGVLAHALPSGHLVTNARLFRSIDDDLLCRHKKSSALFPIETKYPETKGKRSIDKVWLLLHDHG
jgi:hypothetical protein